MLFLLKPLFVDLSHRPTTGHILRFVQRRIIAHRHVVKISSVLFPVFWYFKHSQYQMLFHKGVLDCPNSTGILEFHHLPWLIYPSKLCFTIPFYFHVFWKRKIDMSNVKCFSLGMSEINCKNKSLLFWTSMWNLKKAVRKNNIIINKIQTQRNSKE